MRPGGGSRSTDLGLLLLRLGVGGMMLFAHGGPKLLAFSEKAATFGDPIGLGGTTSLLLAIGAEFFCSLLIITGAVTRLAAVPLLITMLVAAFVVHLDDPWGKKEFALLYALPFLMLIFTGPGRYSVDGYWRHKRTKA